MRKYSKLTGLLLALCAMLLTVTPALAQTQPSTGSLRLVNASPDAPALDIFLNQTKAFSNLTFKTISDYTSFPDGSYTIRAFAAPSNGTGTPLFEVPDFTVNNGSISTVVAVGTVKNKTISGLPLSDENWITTSNSSQAKVRFIHSSPDAPAVNVTAQGLGDVFNNISFKSVGNYVTVPSGPLTLEVKPVSNPSQVVFSDTLNLQANKVYSVFVVGQVSGEPGLATVVAADTAISGMPATGQGDLNPAETGGLNWGLIGLLAIVAIGSLFTWRRCSPAGKR